VFIWLWICLRNSIVLEGELKRNIVGTHWEPKKMGKKSFPTPPPSKTLKEEKQGTLSARLGLPIGCMKFLFPKELRRTHCKEHPTYYSPFNLNWKIGL